MKLIRLWQVTPVNNAESTFLMVLAEIIHFGFSNNRMTAEGAVLLGRGVSVSESLQVLKVSDHIQCCPLARVCAVHKKNKTCILTFCCIADGSEPNAKCRLLCHLFCCVQEPKLVHASVGLLGRCACVCQCTWLVQWSPSTTTTPSDSKNGLCRGVVSVERNKVLLYAAVKSEQSFQRGIL